MKTYICPFCLREINHCQIKKHLRTHNLKDIEEIYFNVRFKNREEYIPKIILDYNKGLCIGDLIEKYNFGQTEIYHILNYKNVKRRSNSESKKTEQYKEKCEKIFLERYGVKNPSQNEDIKNKKIKTMVENYNRINNFQDPSIRKYAQNNIDYENVWESIQNTLKERYNVENWAQIPSVRKSISESHKERCSKMTYDERREMTSGMRAKLRGWTSKLELRVQEILNDLKIEYTNNKFLLGYNYDIIFPNKVILEIMGDFWHANPEFYKEDDLLNFPGKKKYAKEIWKYDERKRKIAEKNGYKMIYIWENELNKLDNIQIFEYLQKHIFYENKRIKNN